VTNFKRIITIACSIVAFLFAHGHGYAQPPSDTVKPPKITEKLIKPVVKGQPAPFTGLLVPEARFVEMVNAEITVDELKGKLEIQVNLTHNLEEMYTRRMEEMASPPKWYQTGEFNFWVGFTTGVVVSGMAIYGAVRIVEASR
jgi:hypothetical protein